RWLPTAARPRSPRSSPATSTPELATSASISLPKRAPRAGPVAGTVVISMVLIPGRAGRAWCRMWLVTRSLTAPQLGPARLHHATGEEPDPVGWVPRAGAHALTSSLLVTESGEVRRRHSHQYGASDN